MSLITWPNGRGTEDCDPSGDAALAQELLGLSGPAALKINSKSVELPGGVCASFAVVGYPREVGAGWLEPLSPTQAVALHVEPVPALVAAQRLRRQLARLPKGVLGEDAERVGQAVGEGDAIPDELQ
jgi:hypothetical protein